MGSMTQASGASRRPSEIVPAPTSAELDRLALERAKHLRQAPNDWHVWESTGSANVFHHFRPDSADHEIWIRRLEAEALILGSAQRPDVLHPDIHRRPLEICRRRSGGGLVHLDPSTDLWIDILLPTSSPLWVDDLARSFHWLGDLWVDVLRACFPNAELEAHRGPTSGSGDVLCFAGLGHGEVTLGDNKIVGLSQRRTRQWTRLQCAVIQQWSPGWWLGVLNDPETIDPQQVRAGLPDHLSTINVDVLAHQFVQLVTSEPPAGRLTTRCPG